MAKSAVTELTAHIESIRQEAYNEGYAEAMRAVVEFSTSGTAKPTTTTAKRPSAKAISTKSTITTTAEPRRQGRVRATPAVRRTTSRGDNARHIAEALSALPEGTGPAAAIRKVLAAKGFDMPYTAIRHALGQLQARGEASVAEDGRTWRYTAPQH
jgi:hypothetical protein